MKPLNCLFLAVALATPMGLWAAMPEHPITVNYVSPENFTDVQVSHMTKSASRDLVFPEITKHIQQVGASYLKPGQHLQINITDIDMAGQFEPWHGPEWDDVRILKEIYPPRVVFNYKLTDADGKVVSSGKNVRLTDMSYLQNIRQIGADEGYYEEQLFDTWFSNDFNNS